MAIHQFFPRLVDQNMGWAGIIYSRYVRAVLLLCRHMHIHMNRYPKKGGQILRLPDLNWTKKEEEVGSVWGGFFQSSPSCVKSVSSSIEKNVFFKGSEG